METLTITIAEFKFADSLMPITNTRLREQNGQKCNDDQIGAPGRVQDSIGICAEITPRRA